MSIVDENEMVVLNDLGQRPNFLKSFDRQLGLKGKLEGKILSSNFTCQINPLSNLES